MTSAPSTSAPARPAEAEIGRGLTLLLATACGVSVASLYYAQPLLHSIAAAFHSGSGTAGLVVTLAQIGYAVGLALVVPLGDILPRRRLVPGVLVLATAAMVASSLAPTLAALIALALAVGISAVGAQVLIPLAASLAGEERRGKVVGTVMTGLLLGILLARTASGLVAGATSWRVMYAVGAALVLLMALVLARALPADGERPRIGYGTVLRSVVGLMAGQPLLRRRAVFGALAFAAFSIFWTTIAFLLSGAPFHYSTTVIGLFGLAGAGGALCANFAGRIADRNHTAAATVVFAACIAGSFVPIWFGRHSVGVLVVGIVVLDIGVQGMQVTNQSLIYGIGDSVRSRLNSGYMVCYFVGGAVGSALAGAVYSSAGWAGVCILGAAAGVIALAGSLLDRLAPTEARSLRG